MSVLITRWVKKKIIKLTQLHRSFLEATNFLAKNPQNMVSSGKF